ncbi:hypothetical protein WG66_001201 [Moniliophthora roreri]|nr:hypothetical protein WG66_001201 [Moniliophthora roreri]
MFSFGYPVLPDPWVACATQSPSLEFNPTYASTLQYQHPYEPTPQFLDFLNDFTCNPQSPSAESQSGTLSSPTYTQSTTTTDHVPSPPEPRRRAPVTTESERRRVLENDPWCDISRLTPHSVVCKGCGKELTLDKGPTRKYYPGHWKYHRSRCLAIRIKSEAMGLRGDDGYWDAYTTSRKAPRSRK